MSSASTTSPPARSAARAWLAVAALALLLVSPGCASHDDGSSPEGAVRALIAAARAGDRLAVYQRLGPRTRARVEGVLASSARTGATRILRPEDLITVGWVPPAWEAAGTRLLYRRGDEAEVEVFSAGGDRQSVHLVRETKSWKVELALR